MASSFTTVDLSKLPLPAVVEQIDFEVILAEMISDLRERIPEFDALVESDPAFKIIEACAYREVLVRQRANESAHATMLAYAIGTDLDNIGANFNVQRLLLAAGDPEATPPVPDTFENDEDFRRRIQLSFEGYSTAGSEGSYVFHALSADGDVKDASVTSPTPGVVNVYVLSRTGTGAASGDLVDAVEAALSAEDVRPLTDNVAVFSAGIVEYAIEAELILYPGPDETLVEQAAMDAIEAHVENIKRMGLDVSRSAIFAQLHQAGVQNVDLTQPAADVEVLVSEAAHCTGITLTVSAGRNE